MNKLGFGCLRLPHIDPKNERDIDDEKVNQLVDAFLEKGGIFFDTAYVYQDGASEDALRRCLTSRHPRDTYQLCTKMPSYVKDKAGDCENVFQEQLDRCGVEYFDVYMLHWLSEKNYETSLSLKHFDFLQKVKADGRAKRIGFSYHGGPECLDRILTEQPEVDCVLLQINYLDWESPSIQAKLCYETVVRHGKELFVMEPVKGGNLANLTPEAAAVLLEMNPDASMASWAIRFAMSLEHVDIVLSGMNEMDQMEDNMQDFAPLNEEELEALSKAAAIINANTAVPCTGCGYCLSSCPMKLPIPKFFALYNDYVRYTYEDWQIADVYAELTKFASKASACIGCQACEAKCPQTIPIAKYMKEVAEAFED